MDTTTNELQALRQELDAFRKETVAMFNELAKHHALLNNSINFTNSQNLKIYLTRLAGMQTAQFIADNMPKVKSFDNRSDYLKYVINHTESAWGGGYLEFGVFAGETINLLSSTLPDKIIYGFDSFEGLPETWRDGFDTATFDREGVLPQVNANVRLVKGWFNETLPEFVKAHPEQCAFIHIDCDLYSSTKIVLDTLKNQIGAGTVIAFDEYFNYPGWKDGEYKAFMEFIAWSGLEFEYIARTNSAQVSVKIK